MCRVLVFRVFCVPRHGFSVSVIKRRGGGSATLPLGPKTYPQKNPNPAGPPLRGSQFSAIIHIVSRRTGPRGGADASVFSRGEGKDDMKNLTFALACASTFALFAAIDAPKADFEGYAAGAKVSDEVEPDSQSVYWLYDGASGSEDGSTVKAYGGENLPAPAAGGQNYLELSTEGGTLWRSLAVGNTHGEGIDNKLGAAQALPADGLYIDTMVQFTPTEDGGAPETTGGDKLAIWLNVDSSSGVAPVTNLMVRAGFVDDNGATTVSHKSYKLITPSPVIAGEWYRLTVRAIKDVSKEGTDSCITGFTISLDNSNPLSTDEDTFGKGYLDLSVDQDYGWLQNDEVTLNLLKSKTIFPSLLGKNTLSTLQAVGFKGSGALDNLSISETAPSPAPEEPIPVTPQITLSATEATFSDSLELPTVTVAGNYVLGTDYTVSWSGALPTENPSADVVLTVTVELCGKYSGNNTATFTVKPAGTPPVVDDWPTDPTTVGGKTAGEAYGFTGDLAGVPADKLARWATGNGTVAFSDAGTIKIEAYLLNVANDDAAIVAGKANFKIPAITVDANGTVTVTSPDPDGSKYNGVITIKGSVTVNGTYDLVKGADDKFPEGARFFKAFLSVK